MPKGHRVALANSGNRSWTPVQRDGAPLAAIVHDAASADERRLLTAAGTTAGPALDDEPLGAERRARVAELEPEVDSPLGRGTTVAAKIPCA